MTQSEKAALGAFQPPSFPEPLHAEQIENSAKSVPFEDDTDWIKPWRLGDPLQHPLPRPGASKKDGSTRDPWAICADLGKQYDKERCDSWRAEIENLLVFAGLFSAVVTAFTVESFKLLQPDPGETTSTVLLAMNQQLSNLVQLNINSSIPPIPVSPPNLAFTPPPFAVHVNLCWFTSLTLSLSTGVIGILALQWLRAYHSGSTNLPAQATVELRALRLRGLESWKVPQIIASLPVLLQAALALFLAGMIILLWNTNRTVLVPVAVFVGLTVVFLVGTTVLPAATAFARQERLGAYAQAPYKSPQAWAFRPLYLGPWLAIARVLRVLRNTYRRRKRRERSVSVQTVVKFRHRFSGRDEEQCKALLKAGTWAENDFLYCSVGDRRGYMGDTNLVSSLKWMATHLSQDTHAVSTLLQCVAQLGPSACRELILDLSPPRSVPTPHTGHAPNFVLDPAVVGYLGTLPHKDIKREMWTDLALGFTLDFLASRNRQLAKILFNTRFEIFCRIVNAKEPVGLLTANRQEGESSPVARLEKGEVGVVEAQIMRLGGEQEGGSLTWSAGYDALTSDCCAQWLRAFYGYFTKVRINEIVFMMHNAPNLTNALVHRKALDHAAALNRRITEYISKPMPAGITTSEFAHPQVPAVIDPIELRDRLAKTIAYLVAILHITTSLDFQVHHQPSGSEASATPALHMHWAAYCAKVDNTTYTRSVVDLARTVHLRLRALSSASAMSLSSPLPTSVSSPLSPLDTHSMVVIPAALPDPVVFLRPGNGEDARVRREMVKHPFALLSGWYQGGWAKALLALIPGELSELEVGNAMRWIEQDVVDWGNQG